MERTLLFETLFSNGPLAAARLIDESNLGKRWSFSPSLSLSLIRSSSHTLSRADPHSTAAFRELPRRMLTHVLPASSSLRRAALSLSLALHSSVGAASSANGCQGRNREGVCRGLHTIDIATKVHGALAEHIASRAARRLGAARRFRINFTPIRTRVEAIWNGWQDTWIGRLVDRVMSHPFTPSFSVCAYLI